MGNKSILVKNSNFRERREIILRAFKNKNNTSYRYWLQKKEQR